MYSWRYPRCRDSDGGPVPGSMPVLAPVPWGEAPFWSEEDREQPVARVCGEHWSWELLDVPGRCWGLRGMWGRDLR